MRPSDDQAKKLTSEEAAALLVSGGRTTDPALAPYYDDKFALNMDSLQKAHLRRMMGFDFGITLRNRKISVFSQQEPYVRTWCGYDGELDEKGVDRLVTACLRLKKKYEAEQAKEANG